MIIFRRLTHEDYDDIVDIAKGVWGGSDYLPQVFHEWVDSKGFLMGAVDDEKNKVIGVAKYSVLYDNSGWLEGLRVHKDYRGRKIARQLSEKMLNLAKDELKKGNINKIAFGTYIGNIESINLMEKLDFKLEQQYMIIDKESSSFDNSLNLEQFKTESWHPEFEEFINLEYFKRRNNILPLAFVFQNPTRELYNEFIEHNNFISINGYKGLFKLKGEPYFEAFDESFEAINTFMNYYHCTFKGKNIEEPLTSVIPEDTNLVNELKNNGFNSWSDWKPDYFLYIYENRE